MTDFVALRAVAQDLIEENGRAITLQKLSTTAADVNRPWRGTATPTAVNPVVTFGCFVPLAGSGLGKEFIASALAKRAEEVCLVAGAAGLDLSEYDRVLDGSTLWGIEWIKELKPGEVSMLFAIGVKR